ncbi:UxaA family hydrolase [Streptomyces sp. NPDC055722]
MGDDILRRTLRGYLGHANVAATLVISLGCEVNQPENVLAGDDAGVETLTIQELGGTAATVNAALAPHLASGRAGDGVASSTDSARRGDPGASVRRQ